MNEASIQEFWQAHPCGDHLVGGLAGTHDGDLERIRRRLKCARCGRKAARLVILPPL